MARYIIDIQDATLEAGIVASFRAHNDELPAVVDGAPNPAILADAAAYVQWLLENAAASYVVQFKILEKAEVGIVADVLDLAVQAGIPGAIEARAIVDEHDPRKPTAASAAAIAKDK